MPWVCGYVRAVPPQASEQVGDKASSQLGHGGDDQVRLTLPARPEYVRLARITASGLASRLGFSWDEIEDLRLAVDELCHALLSPLPTDGTMRLRYAMADDAIEVFARLDQGPGKAVRAPAIGDLSHQILSALVDEHRLVDPESSLWIRKVRRDPAP